MQFTSHSTIACNHKYCENSDVSVEDYTAMLKVLEKVDHLIDIVNTTGIKMGKKRAALQ